MRLNVLRNIAFVSLGLIIFALAYTQIIRGEYYYNQSLNNRIRLIPADAPRGRILDRRGTVLADNRHAFHLGVIAQEVEDKDDLFNFLAGVLNKNADFLKKLYNRKRGTPFVPVIVAEYIDRKTLITIEENRFLYPGLVVEEGFDRFYPFGGVNAHALGYVGRIDPDEASFFPEYGYTPLSTVGKGGIEKFYDPLLRGQAGGRQIEVNSRGQQVRLLGIKEPQKGQDLTLALDQRVQSAADELLGGRRGAVVVMDLSNGDVLGLVSSPSYDPQNIQKYLRDASSPLLNRAVNGQFPPGSVFKVPVALGSLQAKKITPEKSFECPGYLVLGRTRFGCSHVHGVENVWDALAHSCNVYFFHLGLITGPNFITQYARAFGLGRPTGIDLPFESKGGLVRLPGSNPGWYKGNTLNLSIGQGDTLATPLQLMVMMGAVATDGFIFRPRLLKAIDGKATADVNLKKLPRVRLRDEVWKVVQDGLRRTITDEQGTAHELNEVPNVKIWGKTGTAQAGAERANHAWFAGWARSEKANLVFCVFLEHGGSSANAVILTRDLLLRLQTQGVI